MRRARANAENEAEVTLYSAQFAEDRDCVPHDFTATPDLQLSAPDLHAEKKFRLPLIREILERLYSVSDAEYLIYTNVDIALYPDFYREVCRRIGEGYDAMIINRRRIPDMNYGIDDLDQMMKEPGKKHPGFDCFVFHRSLYPKLVLEDICIGVPFFEITFSQNIFCHAKNFRLFEDERLTFHIGMEIFKRRAPREYLHYNRSEYYKAIAKLRPCLDSRKLPYAREILPVRWIRWGLHPCIPIRLALQLDLQRMRGKR